VPTRTLKDKEGPKNPHARKPKKKKKKAGVVPGQAAPVVGKCRTPVPGESPAPNHRKKGKSIQRRREQSDSEERTDQIYQQNLGNKRPSGIGYKVKTS